MRFLWLLLVIVTACSPARVTGTNRATTGGHSSAAQPICDVAQASVSRAGWRTDFTRCLVSLSEFRGAGPPRDGIPPVDRPKFESVGQADSWLQAREPVIYLEVGGEARAYPLQIMTWHEIVNDEVAGTPVSVTFCPLCNTAIVFDRRLDDRVLDFGTTGNLRLSDLVMWDRQTESWWQQASGESLVGELAGARLTMLPAATIAWSEFKAQRPTGQVLSRDTGHQRDYGRNPYVGYDDVSQSPFLFDGPSDGRLRPMERVVTVSLGGEDVAYPFTALADRRVIADSVGGQRIVLFYQPGAASALDARDIASSRDVGAAGVYRPTAGDQALTFAWKDGAFVDAETGSRWTLLGEAVSGPLAGSQLQPVTHTDAFWFASAAFFSTIRIWAG
jgi:Protein of unknown function (DUF3179)